jgi:hypothetical protein
MVVTVSKRKPLSTLPPNGGSKRAQLSLDNFFHRPSAKVKTLEPSSQHKTIHDAPPSPHLDSAEESSFPNFDDSDLEDFPPSPPKKARKLILVPDKKVKNPRAQVQRTLTSTAPRSSRQAADQSDLPPLSNIPQMFDDMVSRAGKLGRVVDRLNGRKLRVATMCSGTESPLLALRMISRSLFKETGKNLEVEHIFSCEIEPFKQAYIERNFAPPILFRDVLELADDYA